MKKISFCLPSENFVQILPESVSGSALVPDPYPDLKSKMLDPDPHITNADPKHCSNFLPCHVKRVIQ
jgi:hypothetical protein